MGWIHNARSSGKIKFIIVRDGTGFVQSVAGKGDVTDEEFALLTDLGQESSVEVTGTVREDKRAPGGYELTLSGIKVLSRAEDFPITLKDHGSSFLLDHRHDHLRQPGANPGKTAGSSAC